MPVLYLDMMAEESALQMCVLKKVTLWTYLASRVSDQCIETIPELQTLWDLSNHLKKESSQNGSLPILLLDEFDSFVKVAMKYPDLMQQMNLLISTNRNSTGPFRSILCAGTFTIVAIQTSDMMELGLEGEAKTGTRTSGDSAESVVRSLNGGSPWNKANIIQTKNFSRDLFKPLAMEIYSSHLVSVDEAVIDDIFDTTHGHPGFCVGLLINSVQQTVGMKSLSIVDWMSAKRDKYNNHLCQKPTMKRMLELVKSSRSVKEVLCTMVRYNRVTCSNTRLTSFLQAVGIAVPGNSSNHFLFNSPIIRDCLLQHFYPPYGNISNTIEPPDANSENYMLRVLLEAIPAIEYTTISDALVTYEKGLLEAAAHAELYRILSALFRNQPVVVRTETKVVINAEDRCDLWLK